MKYDVHIIRLNGNQLSEELASDAYQAAADFDFNPIYFNAIDKHNSLNFIKSEKLFIAKDKKMNNSLGTIGCFCSHYSLWKRTSIQDNPSIILEHDGIIIRDFKKIIHLVEDVCHLDPFNPYSSNYEDDIALSGKIQIQDYQRAEEKKKKFTGGYFRGAYGYILTPQGAKKLIDFVKRNGCFTADRCICENALTLKQTSFTCVRLHKFFDNPKKIREYSTRD